MQAPRGLLPLHRNPVFWLVVASGLTALFLWRGDRFVPQRDADTSSYEHSVLRQHAEHDRDLEGQTLLLRLASVRTFVYPLFLDLVQPITPDYGLVPRIHWLVFTLAALFFWHAVAVFSGRRWFALAVAAPLVVMPPWLEYLVQVMPESLAATFALLAAASLLLLAKRPASALAWVALAVSTLLAYQTKPAFLFLVALVPVLAPLLRALAERRRPASLARWSLGILAVTALPLLLFCTLRLAVVGHFGLVSFTGYNLVGITAGLIDPELVASLPAEQRPLAEAILEERRRQGLEPYSLGDRIHPPQYKYIWNQWFIAEPAARRIIAADISSGRTPEAEREPFSMVIDRRLMGLSLLTLREKPRHYLEWVRQGIARGLGRALRPYLLHWPAVLLAISLALTLPLRLLRRGTGAPATPSDGPERLSLGTAVSGVALVAASFYLANLALIVLVSWPLDRYVAVASLLLPSLFGATIFALWASALHGLGSRLERLYRRRRRLLAGLELAVLAALIAVVVGPRLMDRRHPAATATPIWADRQASAPGEPAAFFAGRDFWLPYNPSAARLLIRAEQEYRLFVNGALVGSDRWAAEGLLDRYEVGDLLHKERNRLAVDLRSVSGSGELTLRLDVKLPGRRSVRIVSDRDWWTVERFDPAILHAKMPLASRLSPTLISPSGRRGLRASPRLPRVSETLQSPPTLVPRRVRRGLRGGEWREFDPAAGSRGTRLTFDWGEPVTGYLNLSFHEPPTALVYTGLEPPDPRAKRAQALVLGLSGVRSWSDTGVRRFRYVTVDSKVRVAGAWIDAVEPWWGERLLAAGEPPDGAPPPALEEIWRGLRGTSSGKAPATARAALSPPAGAPRGSPGRARRPAR